MGYFDGFALRSVARSRPNRTARGDSPDCRNVQQASTVCANCGDVIAAVSTRDESIELMFEEVREQQVAIAIRRPASG
jgi:hypothetical protein